MRKTHFLFGIGIHAFFLSANKGFTAQEDALLGQTLFAELCSKRLGIL
jgi:hypothetical protein